MDGMGTGVPDKIRAALVRHDWASDGHILGGPGIFAAPGLATHRDEDELWSNSHKERIHHVQQPRRYLLELWRMWSPLRCELAVVAPNASPDGPGTWEQRCADALFGGISNDGNLHSRVGNTDAAAVHNTMARTRCMDEAWGTLLSGGEDRQADEDGGGCRPCGAVHLRPEAEAEAVACVGGLVSADELDGVLVQREALSHHRDEGDVQVATAGTSWVGIDAGLGALPSDIASLQNALTVVEDPATDVHAVVAMRATGSASSSW